LSHQQPPAKQGAVCYKQGAACYNLVATLQPAKQVARPLYIGDVTTLQPIFRFSLYGPQHLVQDYVQPAAGIQKIGELFRQLRILYYLCSD